VQSSRPSQPDTRQNDRALGHLTARLTIPVWLSSIPLLTPLPLHGDAGRVTDLDPGGTRAGATGPSTLLETMPSAPSRLARTRSPHPRRCVRSAGCPPRSRTAAAPAPPCGIAVRPASRRDNSSNRDKPSGPSTTASPSIVRLLALIIGGSRDRRQSRRPVIHTHCGRRAALCGR
jgi:hypothetical protein